ncbi:WXG100 family type VII secretion target [Nocardia sp. NPDC050717]|jgi:WXG100 family type VII secretion target|uniref:WXG100 family type VII secretion target n=1 Tax=Nocardia sp. NPDC050717 TaxID=3157221 RepID=UPI0033F97305
MGFNATPAEIQAFSTKMKDKHDAIQGMITRAEGHANDVNSPAFQGAAGQAFQTSMREYLDNASKLNTALFEASDKVSQIAGLITDEEVDNASQIVKAGPQLNI